MASPSRSSPRLGVPRLIAALVATAALLAGCTGDDATAGDVDGRGRSDQGPAGSEATSPSESTTTAPPVTLPLAPTTTPTVVDRGSDPPVAVADPEGPPGRNSIMVVGDSVLMGAASAIPLELAEWVVTFDAEGSRRLAQAVELFERRRDELGGAVVIMLGNNYIQGERGDYASQIEEVMATLWFVPRVVWVTVAEVNPGRSEINEAIRAASQRWPNMRVADWAPVLAADPALSWDGLHLTVAGRERLARLLAETLGPVDP